MSYCFFQPGKQVLGFGLCFASLLLSLAAIAQAEEPPYRVKEIPGVGKIRLLPPGPMNPRNSEGDFIERKDGGILFIYTHFTGGTNDDAAAYLASRVSSDGGKTWSEKDVIVVEQEGDFNVMSVSLLRLRNGKIALFYLRKNSVNDCRAWMRISSDEGRTWSEPSLCIEQLGYFVLNNDRALQLNDGRILLPVALHENDAMNHKFNHQGIIYCYYSDDNGRSWRHSEPIKQDSNLTLQEPGVVELKDGRVMMFCRTPHGSQYISFSENSGKAWTEFGPSNITSPLSPATIERIPKTGDLLLVYNNHYQVKPEYRGKRTPFNSAISRDDGKTWESFRTLEDDPNGWYCYTAMDFVGSHVLLGHCAGDRRKGGLNTTQITRVPLNWFYSENEK